MRNIESPKLLQGLPVCAVCKTPGIVGLCVTYRGKTPITSGKDSICIMCLPLWCERAEAAGLDFEAEGVAK
jgi:hypothetical protein